MTSPETPAIPPGESPFSGGTSTDVTKWDTEVIEAFAAELDRIAEVFKGFTDRAPSVVESLSGGASLDSVPPVYRPTVQGIQQSVTVLGKKAAILSGSLTRDAAVLRAFAKDADDTDDTNAASIAAVDGQV